MRHEFVDRGSDQTIAAFASASTAHADTHFEWQATLEQIGVNALLLMDERRSWWHSCIDDALALIVKYKPSKLIGSSMGGYGALLFAQLTGIPARAFAPQTTIDCAWDSRYDSYWTAARKETTRPDLLALTISGDQHHLHYCRQNEIDHLHASRLAVKLFPHNCSSHKVAHFMDKESAL